MGENLDEIYKELQRAESALLAGLLEDDRGAVMGNATIIVGISLDLLVGEFAKQYSAVGLARAECARAAMGRGMSVDDAAYKLVEALQDAEDRAGI